MNASLIAFIHGTPAGAGWKGICPCHDDRTRSLVYYPNEDTGTPQVKCLAGCLKDTVKAALVDAGVWPAKGNGEDHPTVRIKLETDDSAESKSRPSKKPEPSTKSKVKWESRVPADAPDPVPPRVNGLRLVARYVYLNADGSLIGYTYRYDGPAPTDGSKLHKEFRPQNWIDGNWQTMAPPSGDRPLFNQPALVQKTNGPVLLVEGEKTALAAAEIPELSAYAVLSVYGGKGGIEAMDLTPLAGRKIYIWADADSNWPQTIESWVGVLERIKPKSIHFVVIPADLVAFKAGWDLADNPPDWLDIQEMLDTAREARDIHADQIDAIERQKTPQDLLDNFVASYADRRTIYYEIQTKVPFTKETFNDAFRDITAAKDKPLPHAYYSESKKTKGNRVTEITFGAGKPAIFVQPPEKGGNKAFNVYVAPMIQRIPGNIKPYLDIFDYVLPDKADNREIACRLANMVQNPGNRPDSAVLWCTEQGLGKNSVIEPFKYFVGKGQYYIAESADMFGSWNDWLAGRILLICDETYDPQRRIENYNHAKTMITAEEISLRKKYSNSFMVPNSAHIFVFSNYETPFLIPPKERRFYVINSIGKIFPLEASVYREYYAWLADSKNRSALYDYWMSYDLGSWEPKGTPPVTQAKVELIDRSTERKVSNFVECYESRLPPFSDDVVEYGEFAAMCVDAGFIARAGQLPSMLKKMRSQSGIDIQAMHAHWPAATDINTGKRFPAKQSGRWMSSAYNQKITVALIRHADAYRKLGGLEVGRRSVDGGPWFQESLPLEEDGDDAF